MTANIPRNRKIPLEGEPVMDSTIKDLFNAVSAIKEDTGALKATMAHFDEKLALVSDHLSEKILSIQDNFKEGQKNVDDRLKRTEEKLTMVKGMWTFILGFSSVIGIGGTLVAISVGLYRLFGNG